MKRYKITPVMLNLNNRNQLVTQPGRPIDNVTIDGLMPVCMEWLRDDKQDDVAHVNVTFDGMTHTLADRISVKQYIDHARAGTLNLLV